MNVLIFMQKQLLALSTIALFGAGLTVANATEPCGDFGECKVLIEINASDGDIGFHFLGDGDDLIAMAIFGPDGKIFFEKVKGPFRDQYLTETFAESAEPLCWEPEEGDDEFGEPVVSLDEFIDRWSKGKYDFIGIGDGWEISTGHTWLRHKLPAAPDDLAFDGSVISWTMGSELGECWEEGDELPPGVSIITNPAQLDSFEVVLEPDVDDGDVVGTMTFTVRVPPDQTQVTVPADYLAALPADTPAKIEVGAIGAEDNATFSEEDGFCVNEDAGCEED